MSAHTYRLIFLHRTLWDPTQFNPHVSSEWALSRSSGRYEWGIKHSPHLSVAAGTFGAQKSTNTHTSLIYLFVPEALEWLTWNQSSICNCESQQKCVVQHWTRDTKQPGQAADPSQQDQLSLTELILFTSFIHCVLFCHLRSAPACRTSALPFTSY